MDPLELKISKWQEFFFGFTKNYNNFKKYDNSKNIFKSMIVRRNRIEIYLLKR